jgi:hypothetical protein
MKRLKWRIERDRMVIRVHYSMDEADSGEVSLGSI